jgi:hypothetical protein
MFHIYMSFKSVLITVNMRLQKDQIVTSCAGIIKIYISK